MKYLKISSLLVLSLLLFAPAALADVTCELRPASQRIRMESQHEMLGTSTRPLTVLCMSGPAAGGTLDGTGANDGGLVLADAAATDADDRSTFDLELQFSGEISNMDGMDVELHSAVTRCIGKALRFPKTGPVTREEPSRLPVFTSMQAP